EEVGGPLFERQVPGEVEERGVLDEEGLELEGREGVVGRFEEVVGGVEVGVWGVEGGRGKGEGGWR
ncbi:hypothetical protein, partial [Kocuria salsicia]|uniref:hypothetical protein n=1 Tax=Kocuria salsicia TaxID=664639 RepID=UPI001C92D68A